MKKDKRILLTAYRLSKEGRDIHTWSVYLRMVDEHYKWMTKENVGGVLRSSKDALEKIGTVKTSHNGAMAVYKWVGGDNYFAK